MKAKRFGGEREDLMESNVNHNSVVPKSIELLFNNEKLEIMKVLCLLNVFSTHRKKKTNSEEILYYYGLVNFKLVELLEDHNRKVVSPNLFLRFQNKLASILIIMSHLEFIEIQGELTNKVEDLNITLTEFGKVFFEDYKDVEYFSKLFLEYKEVLHLNKYSKSNLKILRGRIN